MRIVKSISLPADLVVFLQSQVKKGGYMSVSEYLREIIRAHKEKQIFADLRESEEDFAKGKVLAVKSMKDLK